MIYIAICDDDKRTVRILEEKIVSYIKENKILAEYFVYTNSMMLQYDIQEGKYFDLILTDIEMPDIDGMTLASYIKVYLPEVLIIFITSHLKYAIDAFELSVFRYIPKSLINSRLKQALEDAIKMIMLQSEKYYLIQMPSRIEKVPYQKIVCIQREGKNSVIILIDSSNTKVRKSLSTVYEELESDDFVYADRGTIINLAHIMGIKDGIIHMKNGMSVSTSQTKLEQIKVRLNEFWGGKI